MNRLHDWFYAVGAPAGAGKPVHPSVRAMQDRAKALNAQIDVLHRQRERANANLSEKVKALRAADGLRNSTDPNKRPPLEPVHQSDIDKAQTALNHIDLKLERTHAELKKVNVAVTKAINQNTLIVPRITP